MIDDEYESYAGRYQYNATNEYWQHIHDLSIILTIDSIVGVTTGNINISSSISLSCTDSGTAYATQCGNWSYTREDGNDSYASIGVELCNKLESDTNCTFTSSGTFDEICIRHLTYQSASIEGSYGNSTCVNGFQQFTKTDTPNASVIVFDLDYGRLSALDSSLTEMGYCYSSSILDCDYNFYEYDSVQSLFNATTNTRIINCAIPTKSPTDTPFAKPTRNPTLPTPAPTKPPTVTTNAPTVSPSNTPSLSPTLSPTLPTQSQHPSLNPSQSPSKSPSESPSESPSQNPSQFPTNIPSLAPTIDYYFHCFNISNFVNILFNSQMQQHNATNLNNNIFLQNDMVNLLEQVSHSVITDQKINVIAIKITKIWAYNKSVSDNCLIDNYTINNNNNQQTYSSWIHFELKFSNSDSEENWDAQLDTIINIFGNDLAKSGHFNNDTISLSYCQFKDSSTLTVDHDVNDQDSTNPSKDLEYSSLIFTICVISCFTLISLFGFIDAKLVRRNEIFSIGAIMPAATYTLDVVSGL